MARWNVRIGINPISWSNDDLPSLGGETPLETALSEGAEIGFEGFELGGKFPTDPQKLKAKLAEFGVACVSGWYSGQLAEGTLEDEVRRCVAHMSKLAANGCKVVVIDTTHERTTADGGCWWEVGIPETSTRAEVREARREYDAAKTGQRF